MNKKEAAAFEALQQELRLAKAFSWTQPVAPDVLPPSSQERGNRITTGWYFNAYHSGFSGDTVDVGCSSSVFHAKGRIDKTTSQGAISLYSSKLLALKALRHKVEKQVAERLAAIDARIEHELALDASPNGTE